MNDRKLESICHRLDFERRTLTQEGWVLEASSSTSRVRSVDGSHHLISFSSLSNATAETVIADQVAYYRALGVGVEWKVYGHDNPPDLCERLKRHGFEMGPRETVLVMDLEDAPTWLGEQSQQVIRVGNASEVDLFRRSAEEIFGKDYDFVASELLLGIANGSAEHRGYMVMDGDTASSIGRLYTHPNSLFGGLYGGGTLERYRRRGLYRATVAARGRDAATLGARYLIVDALPTSQPILERLGFVRLTDTWPCTLKP